MRIGSGLSFADYVWVRAKPWKPWDPKEPPSFLLTASKSHDDKGDVYLEPEDSFILKVKAAEITKSDQYHMQYTMRFPRALSIRDDLTINDCLTASGVTENIITKKKRKMESDAAISNKKRKKITKKPELMGHKGPKTTDITLESDIFEGMNFVVLADPKSRTGQDDRKQLVTSIIAHGGKSWNVVKDMENQLVVYGGTTKFPEINRIMQKDTYDIVRPQWILDCIQQRQLVPLSKKYCFHATRRRTETQEYNHEDNDENEQIDAPIAVDERVEFKVPDVPEDKDEEPGDARQLDAEPALADWFKVGQDETASTSARIHENSDTETENDSDHDDLPVDEGDDQWVNVESSPNIASGSNPEQSTVEYSRVKAKDEFTDIRMGENDAMEYDENLIFMHLCFYLDTPDNADKNGMVAKSKHSEAMIKNFAEVSSKITENGGKIVDLDEPKLTHVVVDRLDVTRRVKLIERTSRPKRRHLVITEWIRDSLDEGTLLNEEEYVP